MQWEFKVALFLSHLCHISMYSITSTDSYYEHVLISDKRECCSHCTLLDKDVRMMV